MAKSWWRMADEIQDLEWHTVEEASMMGIYFVMDGQTAKVTVNGTTMCAVRRGEELFFVRNRCPHAGGQLSQGWVDQDGYLVCPLHRFRFCLGSTEPGPEGYPLHHFPWRMERNELQVGFPRRKKLFGMF